MTADSPGAFDNNQGISARNIGEPIVLKDVNLCGLAAESGREGDTIKVWTRLALTSDDRMFHRSVEKLNSSIAYFGKQNDVNLDLSRSNTALIVIRPDNTAELWIDAAAVAMQIVAKRSMTAGSLVTERDIADVVAMTFPFVTIGSHDRIIVLFRQDWRFALFFDFNPDDNLDLHTVNRTLGTLYRNIKYRHTYDILADSSAFGKILDSGWFPFIEILGAEFTSLAECVSEGLEIKEASDELVSKFDSPRLENMLRRWLAKPHLASRESILRTAIRCFEREEPVAVVKVVLTELEGMLRDAHRAAFGTGAHLKKLLEFAVLTAEQKTGAPDTLFFTEAFAYYLKSHTFANFNPSTQSGSASSRHAVSHGAAEADSYTQIRALQALLTLDQMAFYT